MMSAIRTGVQVGTKITAKIRVSTVMQRSCTEEETQALGLKGHWRLHKGVDSCGNPIKVYRSTESYIKDHFSY